MKSNLFIDYLADFSKKYTLIFFAVITFLLISFNQSTAEENLFTINDVKVEGVMDLNFNREK